MNTKKIILGLFAAVLTFTSCSDDEGVNFQPVALGAYENGILVNNEGNFLQGNASISFVSNDFSTIENGIFSLQNNNAPLGDTAQSIAFYNNLAYIVVNGSHKIEVVDRYTFIKVATIDTGLNNPRNMVFTNGKGYVTNWGDSSDATDDFIAVIDVATNTVNSTIAIEKGPEKILAINNKLYISHKWGANSVINMIDLTTNAISSITVGATPDEMVFDTSNNIWAISEGTTTYDSNWNPTGNTGAFLQKINTSTDIVELSLAFPTDEFPSTIAYDNGMVYYYANSRVFKMNETDTTLPITQVIDDTLYEGLAVKNGYIYGTTADFGAGTGELVIYDDSTYTLVDTKALKVGSSKIYFN